MINSDKGFDIKHIVLFLQGLDLRQGIQPVEGSKSCFDVSFGQRPGVDEAQGCGVDIFGSDSKERGELWTPCATMEAS